MSLLLACVVSLTGGAACAALAQPAPVNRDARVLDDFRGRVNDYVKLADKATRGEPSLKRTDEPAKIAEAQRARAEGVRRARASARPGDVFTPEVQEVFRRLMRPELKGPDARETKGAIKEDAPDDVPLKVNGDYPKSAPLATMPPDLLARLPELPKPLEYRAIGNHLVLLDVDANVIVDFMRNAVK